MADLELAWSYRTGELGQGAASAEKLTFEATPILFEGALYLSTAFGKVIALDPALGTELWTFDPESDRNLEYSEVASRGVSAWRDPETPADDAPDEDAPGEDTPDQDAPDEDAPAEDGDAACAARIFVATIDARLIALDANTGIPCAGFGEGGAVDLMVGAGSGERGDYQVTSPPAIAGGLVIVGSSIGDNWSIDTGRGVVRAFDARSGDLRWSWDPIPYEAGAVGAANAWAPIAVDSARDLVFVPTGSPSPDFYGGLRPGDNRYANSVVALRASSGEPVWAFQTVHHDLWDYDVAAQPALVTVRREGGAVPAVAQATKMGFVFLLHRETGEPLFPVEERPVPASTVAGERASPTQPFPVLPAPLMPQDGIAPEDAWGHTEEERAACRAMLESYETGPIYTPPSLHGVATVPGNASGTNWGSVAFDPERQLLIVGTSELVTVVRLVPRERHLVAIADARAAGEDWEVGMQRGAPYVMMRKTLLSPSGVPCNPPPWGGLAAIDARTGELRWRVSVGSALGVAGSPVFGGAIATAGGLVFLGATMDAKFRALDIETGELLWETQLPAAAIATPMTYRAADGHQYVVVAAGGHGKIGLPTGDHVLAFRLPD